MSERREQFRATFLAAIMVISMVAMGAAGFAGTAAASEPVEEEDGVFVASNANSEETSVDEHIIRLNVSETDLEDGNLDEDDGVITVDYDEDVNLDSGSFADVASADNGDGSEDLQDDPAIEIYVGDSDEVEANADNADFIQTDDESTITFDFGEADGVGNTNIDGDDIITIVLRTSDGTGDTVDTTLNNPDDGESLSVTLDDGDGSVADFEDIDIALDEDAQISVEDGVASDEDFFNTLDSAVNFADDNNIITVSEDLAVLDDPAEVTFQGNNDLAKEAYLRETSMRVSEMVEPSLPVEERRNRMDEVVRKLSWDCLSIFFFSYIFSVVLSLLYYKLNTNETNTFCERSYDDTCTVFGEC